MDVFWFVLAVGVLLCAVGGCWWILSRIGGETRRARELLNGGAAEVLACNHCGAARCGARLVLLAEWSSPRSPGVRPPRRIVVSTKGEPARFATVNGRASR